MISAGIGMRGRQSCLTSYFADRRDDQCAAQLQHDALSPQSQDGSVPRSAPLMTAVAQPTPDWTKMASVGQFMAQAPHSIQASRSTITARRFSMTKTACGHTSTHIPQPLHFPASNSRVTTLGKYLSSSISTSYETSLTRIVPRPTIQDQWQLRRSGSGPQRAFPS